MNKGIAVSLATISSLIAIGLATLEGITIYTTHSLNPLNIKLRRDFNELMFDKVVSDSLNFKNVKSFVDAKGRGTLLAIGRSKNAVFEFRYYRSSEFIDVPENEIIFKDWQAVREYMNQCKEVEEKQHKQNESTIVVSSNQGVMEKETEQINKSESTKCGLGSELKDVLSRLDVSEEAFDEILHVFWKAKNKYIGSQLYRLSDGKFETFRPAKRKLTFLQAPREDMMKRSFYGEKNWCDWKCLVEGTIGRAKSPNPVSACCAWGMGIGISSLADDMNLSEGQIRECLEKFLKIFYELVGVPDVKHHRVTASQGF